MKNITLSLLSIMLLSLSFVSVASAQSKVVIAGTFQSELGCTQDQSTAGGDWEPNCNLSALTYNSSTGLWSGSFNIPAGCYQYKVTIDGSWVENYGEFGIQGGANIMLYVPSASMVSFVYDPSTHVVITSPNGSGFSLNCLPSVVLAGSFQSELGCPYDWDAGCINSALTYNSSSGLFEGDLSIPSGCYEYKVVLNGDWVNSFGQGGQPNGQTYLLSVPANTAAVHFTYDPYSHIVASAYNSNVCQPGTVVIPGSFQSELGCAGDWMPDCDNSRLVFEPSSGTWVGTFTIPAGHWEYKVALNNSWNENYGQNGIPDGPNIPLDLCYASQVVFRYDNTYHYVSAQVITNGVCLTKFYDRNVSGYPDYGEPPMANVKFTLKGNGIEQIQTTDNEGKASFSGMPNGTYTIVETVPSGYLSGFADSQVVYIYDGLSTVYFGNVCIGAGGAQGMGYWISKNGENALNNAGQMQGALVALQSLNLRNADGSDFDPYTYEQFRNWLKGANAKNMTYMMSAQMAVLQLNLFMGYIGYDSIVYMGDCGSLFYSKFMSVSTLIWGYSNYYLTYFNNSTGNDPVRPYLECLKNAMESANSNLTYVQAQPCGAGNSVSPKIASKPLQATDAKAWPNPSSHYFTVRPAYNTSSEMIQLRVFDESGKMVHTDRGVANKDYRFGESFTPGMYFVELMQAGKRSTFKMLRQ